MTMRMLLRPLIVGSLAVLFGLYLALGAAAPAHAQLEDVTSPLDEVLEGGGTVGDLLETLTLDELLGLLAEEEAPADPAPVADPAPAPVPVATPATGPQPGAQVSQRPVGGVATGAGGATDNGGTTAPLLALGALVLAGTAAGVTRPRAEAHL